MYYIVRVHGTGTGTWYYVCTVLTTRYVVPVRGTSTLYIRGRYYHVAPWYYVPRTMYKYICTMYLHSTSYIISLSTESLLLLLEKRRGRQHVGSRTRYMCTFLHSVPRTSTQYLVLCTRYEVCTYVHVQAHVAPWYEVPCTSYIVLQ